MRGFDSEEESALLTRRDGDSHSITKSSVDLRGRSSQRHPVFVIGRGGNKQDLHATQVSFGCFKSRAGLDSDSTEIALHPSEVKIFRYQIHHHKLRANKPMIERKTRLLEKI